jgi:hypothetical protein
MFTIDGYIVISEGGKTKKHNIKRVFNDMGAKVIGLASDNGQCTELLAKELAKNFNKFWTNTNKYSVRIEDH